MRTVVLGFLCLTSIVLAEENKELSFTLGEVGDIFNPVKPTVIEPRDVIILKGILIVGQSTDVTKSGVDKIEGIEVKNVEIPCGLARLRYAIEPAYIGQPIGADLLQQLKNDIIIYYRDANRPVVTVDIPEQDVTSGILQVVVVEAKLCRVIYKCNQYFSDKLLARNIRLTPCCPIDKQTLLEDLAWMNRSHYRRTDAVFTPGDTEGTTNIELNTEDRMPFSIYVGGDNTGVNPLKEPRWFAGFNWGNAFNVDHSLTYQFTSASNYNRFHSHTINYVAPLPWRHIVNIYGGYSKMRPAIRDFHTGGHSSQASLRYIMPFRPNVNCYLNDLILGFDWKNTNNNFLFLGTETFPFIRSIVNITQLVAGYSYGKLAYNHRFTLNALLFYSPGRWFPHQSNSAFQSLRPGAKNRYVYGRLEIGDTYTFDCNFALYGMARLQGASDPLLPSEQFGLGGYDTVRGYDEREVNADNAACINFEIRTPKFHIFRNCRFNDELYLLAFVDYGFGVNNAHWFAEEKSEHLLGVGPGFRYALNRYFSARFDLGFKLHKTRFGDGHLCKVHVGALLSY